MTYQIKAYFFNYTLMSASLLPNVILKFCDFKTYFLLIFFNMDILLNIEVRYMKLLTELENIPMQGTMSQIYD